MIDKIDCSNCTQVCCEITTYKLTNQDIERIRTAIHDSQYCIEDAVIHNKDGTIQLEQPCLFLDASKDCTIYKYRPLGCKIYPIVYFNGPALDTQCPQWHQVQEVRVPRHTIILQTYLHAIRTEAQERLNNEHRHTL